MILNGLSMEIPELYSAGKPTIKAEFTGRKPKWTILSGLGPQASTTRALNGNIRCPERIKRPPAKP